jgi:hypothetical protein
LESAKQCRPTPLGGMWASQIRHYGAAAAATLAEYETAFPQEEDTIKVDASKADDSLKIVNCNLSDVVVKVLVDIHSCILYCC